MKSIFMRVLFCKIHCPSFICFCKPSAAAAAAAAHLYTSGPLKLENSNHVPSAVVSASSVEAIEAVKEDRVEGDGKQHEEVVLRSCIKRVLSESGPAEAGERKRVHWVDSVGKDLVVIKEFESRWNLFWGGGMSIRTRRDVGHRQRRGRSRLLLQHSLMTIDWNGPPAKFQETVYGCDCNLPDPVKF